METLSTKNTTFKTSIELLLIIGFAAIPLVFPEMPYRVNIYLSWEGAFRLYEGQLPYRDFGLPMGVVYWVIPALFFKLFGPYLITLIKAQVFINIVAAFAFRDILKLFKLSFGERALALIIFGISYVMFNYWPWYNHSVIVYEIISLAFIVRFAFSDKKSKKLLYLIIGAVFAFICFFTKQDGGGMGFIICLAIVAYTSIIERNFMFPIYYIGVFAILLTSTILIFKGFDFGYWFNYGQPPHYSRVSAADIIEDFLAKSFWEKFYLGLMIMILITQITSFKTFLADKQKFLFALFSFAIVGEALVFQVTSYVPANGHIFFHSFAFAYIIHFIGPKLNVDRFPNLIVYSLCLLMWWSSPHWRLIQPFYAKVTPFKKKENTKIVSKNSYIKKGEGGASNQPWVSTPEWAAFKGMKMPQETKQGIIDILNLEIVKEKGEHLKVLNMSELTPLAHTIGYDLPKSSQQPLWYHQGVGLFDREIEYLCQTIINGEYDMVLFEEIPELNNFYPPKVQECLKEHYKLANRFTAPRRNEPGVVEVYLKN
ncbi:hypothetical protein R9C00_29580 (plasmid) [Flammeovirgaceae bacterium SG7u.111]|nr:hypothetical protein [Flammeovirgaceae bacterium SG7u.132]WPO38837.1 hypothetical protein R9C00_29580 [Flammeovirgaceae bacterium SG7u.111]